MKSEETTTLNGEAQIAASPIRFKPITVKDRPFLCDGVLSKHLFSFLFLGRRCRFD